MFCIALAQEDNYSDVEDADAKEYREYKKKARSTAKQLKRKMRFCSYSYSCSSPACKCHVIGKEEEIFPKISWYSVWIDFQLQKVKTGCED